MNKDKDKIDFSDLDAVADFLENEAPSETSLLQSQIAKERYYNPDYKKKWLDRNNKRLNDPAYKQKLSDAQTKWYAENPGLAKERVNTPEARANHRKAMQNYVNSPDYVNPRGMLGKKRTEEAKLKSSIALSGKAKPIEGNKKISEHFKGKKKSASAKAKVSKTMKGRTTNKGRRVMTPKGEFAKITLAARAYGVTDMAIKNKIVNPKHPDFYFLDDIHSLGAQKVHTDKGIFDNCSKAAKAYNISANGLRHRLHSDKWPDFYYLDEKSEFKSKQLR
jgi:hypothetical protein